MTTPRIEEMVEEFEQMDLYRVPPICERVYGEDRQGNLYKAQPFQIDLEKALTEAKQAGYEKGHADALRTIPVYESNNLQDKT